MLRAARLKLTLRFARVMGVPVAVHQSFFAFGKKALKPSPGSPA
jgi:hypothetical protein